MAFPQTFEMFKKKAAEVTAAVQPPPARSAVSGDLVTTLVATLGAQKNLYVQLLALAKQQSQYVSAGETESLMTVLGARARLIDQVAPLDATLRPYKGKWQETLDGLNATDRPVVAGLLKDVQQLLGDILAQDEPRQGIADAPEDRGGRCAQSHGERRGAEPGVRRQAAHRFPDWVTNREG